LCNNSLEKSNNKYLKALTLQVPLHEPKKIDYNENKSEVFNKQIHTYENSSKLNNYGKKGIKYTYYHKIKQAKTYIRDR